MNCENMYNQIGRLVGADIAATLAFLAVTHRRSLFCEGPWSCEGDKVTVDVKPEEVGARAVYRRVTPSRLDLKVAIAAGFVECAKGQRCELEMKMASVVFSSVHRNGGRFRSFLLFQNKKKKSKPKPKPNTYRQVSRFNQ